MRNMGRVAVTAAVLLLWSGTSFAALDKCQKRLQGEGAKLQKFMYGAVQKCADSIRKEKVAGALKGGVDCGTGHACLPNAAAFCEKQIAGVWDADNVKPGKSKVDLFRAAIEKARTPNAAGARECEDEDLALFTGMGHLLSGTGAPLALAPPLGTACDSNGDGKVDANCASVFMTDFLIYATESKSLQQAIQQTPDLLSMIKESIDTLSVNPAKKNTNCAPLDLTPTDESLTDAYRPNLCRFGLSCKTSVCSIDTTGACGTGFGGGSGNACQTTTTPTTCPSGETCIPTASFVKLDSPLIGNTIGGVVPLSMPIFGTFSTEICRPGPTSGHCAKPNINNAACTGSGAPQMCCTGAGTGSCNQNANAACSEDDDCGLNGPCNFFPGQGLGAAFGTAANTLYLLGSASKGIKAPDPLPLPAAFAGAINSVCVDVVQSEGWCDCSGQGVKVSAQVCQDKDALDTAGPNDECGASQLSAEQDPFWANFQNGPLTVIPSGASAPGDCVDMVTLQFKVVTDALDRGPDNIACTDDDFSAPFATYTIPLSTGTVTAKVYDVPDCLGTCSSNTTCASNANCASGEICNTHGLCGTDEFCITAADCSGGQHCEDTQSCGSPSKLASYQISVSGGKPANACAHYTAGDLKSLSLASGAMALSLSLPVGGNDLPVDGLINFKLTCK